MYWVMLLSGHLKRQAVNMNRWASYSDSSRLILLLDELGLARGVSCLARFYRLYEAEGIRGAHDCKDCPNGCS